MSEKKDTYHDTILDLEAKLKKNVDLILKLGNSLQGMFMLGPKPLSVYDQQLKHGLVYPNPYTLKQAISKCLKLYFASSLGNLEIPLNVRDYEDTLKDAFKSQQKMKEKMNDPIAVANKQNCWTINYKQINALYEDFVPQKELSVKQKYFSSSSIPSVKISGYKRNERFFESTESELDELEKQNDLLKDQLLEASLKHDVELCVLLNHECIDKILNVELQQVKKKSFKIQEGLQTRIKILEKDVQRCQKQSVDFKLLLKHEKEKHKWDSTSKNKNTNPLDYSCISKLEKLKNENVSLDFKVQSLIKERDNVKLEYQKLFDSIKKTRSQTQKEMDELIVHVSEKTYAYGAIRAENQNLLSTISELKTRLEKVEKGKSVNTKFDKTNGYQSLLCVTPLNKHAFQKKTDVPKTEENHVVSKPVTLQTSPTKQTGANQNTNVIRPGMYRVVTTQESQTNKTKSALSSTGMNATSRVRRPMSRDSHVAHSVLDNSKKAAKNVAVYVRKNKQTDNTSANVISNKENVIDVDSLSKPVTAQSLPKNEKDQLLKRIAYLESKLASQDIRSCQKEYHELRTLYNALKVKFDSLNRKKRETNVSKSSKPRESVSAKVHTGESSKPFSRRVSQFTTYSFQKDRKFSKNSQSFETLTPQKGFKKSASKIGKASIFENNLLLFTSEKQGVEANLGNLKTLKHLLIKSVLDKKLLKGKN
ncbi:hypothetical protein Tco_0116907 [Tanacetum coccineum]